MKTHEIGIGSFASVMINGKEKHWDSRERGEGERLHFSVCADECAWSCAFNEESKQGRQRSKNKENKPERKLTPRTVCVTNTLVSRHTCDQMWSAYLCVHASRTPENSTHQSSCFCGGGRGVKISSTRKNLLGRISRYFLLLFCSSQSLMELFKWRTSWHITTAACTAITSFWLRAPSHVFLLFCVYNAWTRLEPSVGFLSVRRVRVLVNENEYRDFSCCMTFMCVCVRGWGRSWGGGVFNNLQQSQTTVVFNTHSGVLPWWLGPAMGPDTWGCMFVVCVCYLHICACVCVHLKTSCM